MIAKRNARSEFWHAQHARYRREQLRVVGCAIVILLVAMALAYVIGD